MAYALCSQCGKEHHWRAQRGVRLADLSSPCCHAPPQGKAVERRPSARAGFPRVKTAATEGQFVSIPNPDGRQEPDAHWYSARGEGVLYVRPDGTFLFSRSWGDRYWPDPAPILDAAGREWRVLRQFKPAHDHRLDAESGYIYFRRVPELDYQRLLIKRAHQPTTSEAVNG